MKIILLTIFFLFAFSRVYALENASPDELSTPSGEVFSDKALLNEAKSLRKKDPIKSLRLAEQALLLSKQNNHPYIGAQIHTLLAKLAKQSKNNELALTHFGEAARLHQSINNTRDQIVASVDYINLLLAEKRYQDVGERIDELLVIAEQYRKAWPLALTLIAKADRYYLQKEYEQAILEYKKALQQLQGNDKKILKKRGETYKKIAQTFKRLKKREETAEFYRKTLQAFTALNDKKNMARTLNTLAESERYLGHLLIALDYSIRGLQIHKEINDPEGYAKASTGAGIIYRHIGRYEKSLEHVYQAHLYYKKINDINGIAETSNQLGFIYTRLKQFEEARKFYQLAIDVSGKKLDQNTLASSLREMAVIYLNEEDYDLALVMAEKAHKIYQQENDTLKGSITARVIGNIYRDQNQYERAMTYYKESLDYAKQSGNQLYQIKAEAALAGLLIITNPKQAVEQLNKVLALSVKAGDKTQTLYAYRKLRQAEKILGNDSESLRYAEAEIHLAEILQKEKDDKELILVKAKLYSHDKEIELASLREKSKLDQLELAKKNNEIEIAEKNRLITELKLKTNKYANITLASLLGLAVMSVAIVYRLFIASKKRNKELDYLATRDPLTNCYNRRALFEHMYRDFEGSKQLDEYCIIMVDIDHFKNVNDTYGHSMGDDVICGVAEVLKANLNELDIVARFGGEEFCVYLHQANENKALEIAERMRSQIEKNHFGDINVTCCFGVSSIKFKAKSYLELITQADLALYQSKSLGRNQVTMWAPSFEKGKS